MDAADITQAWQAFKHAERAFRDACGVSHASWIDNELCAALGVVASIVGGVTDPRPGAYQPCVIAADGTSIAVMVVDVERAGMDGGPMFFRDDDDDPLGFDADDDDDEESDEPSEPETVDAETQALVVIEGDDIVAVHLIPEDRMTAVLDSLGVPVDQPLFGLSAVTLGRLFHENILLEPAVALAMGVSTVWLHESADRVEEAA